MKDGNFEKGDKLECVDDSDRPKLKKGGIYTYTESMIRDSTYMYVEEYGNCNLRKSRFKLAEPGFMPEFIPEYFSALNEKDAEPFIGKIMEFADGNFIPDGIWEKDILKKCTMVNFPFETMRGDEDFQFCRTCPETFQKKTVKKAIYAYGVVLLSGDKFLFSTKEAADSYIYHNHLWNIKSVKLTGEYEAKA